MSDKLIGNKLPVDRCTLVPQAQHSCFSLAHACMLWEEISRKNFGGMMRIVIVTTDDDETHMLPYTDDMAHETTKDCVCGPRLMEDLSYRHWPLDAETAKGAYWWKDYKEEE